MKFKQLSAAIREDMIEISYPLSMVGRMCMRVISLEGIKSGDEETHSNSLKTSTIGY